MPRREDLKGYRRLTSDQDMWQGPAFLNEVWDLSWDRAGRELGTGLCPSVEKMRFLLGRPSRIVLPRQKRKAREFGRGKGKSMFPLPSKTVQRYEPANCAFLRRAFLIQLETVGQK